LRVGWERGIGSMSRPSQPRRAMMAGAREGSGGAGILRRQARAHTHTYRKRERETAADHDTTRYDTIRHDAIRHKTGQHDTMAWACGSERLIHHIHIHPTF
jgi:hypothetical protein